MTTELMNLDEFVALMATDAYSSVDLQRFARVYTRFQEEDAVGYPPRDVLVNWLGQLNAWRRMNGIDASQNDDHTLLT